MKDLRQCEVDKIIENDKTLFPTSSTILTINDISKSDRKINNQEHLQLKFKNTLQKSNSQLQIDEVKNLKKLKTTSFKSLGKKFTLRDFTIDILSEKHLN